MYRYPQLTFNLLAEDYFKGVNIPKPCTVRCEFPTNDISTRCLNVLTSHFINFVFQPVLEYPVETLLTRHA